jgi:signal-transduction protein with cAMP-binding, CBS, and nucleotidyltransferase domain
MTEFGFGCITVINDDGSIKGVFTDGDLRRLLTTTGREMLSKKLSELTYKTPVSVEAEALLNEAAAIFKKQNVDTILVTHLGKPVGMLDIQDMK